MKAMTEPLPAWATETIHLEPYDDRWPAVAKEYEAELVGFIGHWLLKPIEHVGSTAIPRLMAKPVIDLQAMVTDMDEVVQQTELALAQRGWKLVPPELDARPWRRLFVKVSADGRHRLAHLHLMPESAERWEQQLRFRDALRKDAEKRNAYADLKQRLVVAHADDREQYTEEKAAFIQSVLADLE